MYKEMFSEFDKIKAPQNIVDKAVSSAISASDERIAEFKVHAKRKMSISILAACLVLTFVCTMLFADRVGVKSNVPASKPYGFVLSANAAQIEKLGLADKAVIGAYATTAVGGWAMYQNFEQYEDFSPNFFQSYGFSNFIIEGDNIESVTFKTKGEGTYFAISPAGYFVNADEETAERIKLEALRDFSYMSLENSQYTDEELKEYSDGLSFGDIYCDTFTYTNSQDGNRIDFSNKLEYVLESNHNKEEISKRLDLIWECEQELIEIRGTHTFESGEPTEEEERLYYKIDTLSQDIRKLILKGAKMEVTVNYSDGRTETKTLTPGLIYTENLGLWLTIAAE
ncbi:MAG: hypothetical protein IKJ83_01840 [Ruminococcus sp.]|nr:hypothetical protein [Ruminococcus sp.]